MKTLHSKYKVPNGKLIIADIVIEDSLIKEIQISGDFFLEPPIVLEMINKALIGLSIQTNMQEIKTIINRAIPENTVFFGFSPESIAITILKAFTNE
ncbi:hypothetical protein CKSOR_00324 [Candidatus Kinetoplastibacterium sorsogonicusi]|uniref:lipoate--protein ligase n=1 Tax=Candidatus Kinetoplastidibacterium kentomonadis TaxID=1576550 RepID=A0A3Q8F3J2_9PROT|nr:lipoate protein ligase C-terminal domain-containing protein [Candidatus Kinetoplastibacterium sorsogonicusi]AWD32445.1 hypothetical protein CKSOR_00324 [Candidatus Kinetoplastibacterium sorsogonicusi]